MRIPNDNPFRYEILSQVETREAYDRYGMEGMSRGGGGFGGGMDPADLFAELFGASMGFGFDFGPGSRGPRRTKGSDSNIPYEVTLEDLYNGKTVKMNMEKEAVCGLCKGCVLPLISLGLSAHRGVCVVAVPEQRAVQSQNSARSAKAKAGLWSRHR